MPPNGSTPPHGSLALWLLVTGGGIVAPLIGGIETAVPLAGGVAWVGLMPMAAWAPGLRLVVGVTAGPLTGGIETVVVFGGGGASPANSPSGSVYPAQGSLLTVGLIVGPLMGGMATVWLMAVGAGGGPVMPVAACPPGFMVVVLCPDPMGGAAPPFVGVPIESTGVAGAMTVPPGPPSPMVG